MRGGQVWVSYRMENYEWLRRTAKETEIHDFIDVIGNGPSGSAPKWDWI
jgi:hypothetical protein